MLTLSTQSQCLLDDRIDELLRLAQSKTDSYSCLIEAEVSALNGLERSG